MLGSSELMDALKGIGLNLYERKLWVALLAKGTATAGELSGIANVPRSRTYDVLQTLADKGFVIVQTSKPLRYVAMSPEQALEKAKENLREKYAAMENKIDKLKKSDLIKELNSMYKDGLKLVSPGDLTGALKGKFSVLQHTDVMFKNASSSVNIVTTQSGLNELFENHIGILKKLNEKGVKIRIAAKTDETSSDAIKALSNVAEIRNISDEKIPLSGRFYTIDGQQFVMALSNPQEVHSSQDMAFWTKSEHAAKNTIEPLFNLVWENSKPINLKEKS
jgi:sugar-specific transcriptional regulator TrmB